MKNVEKVFSFENKKPQINADERGFVTAYLRLFAFICGFFNSNTKTFYNLYVSHTLYIMKRGAAL